jgi:farnesol dehydrogenase
MKIFITGATGFIGNKLALRLANEGHTIHALIRSQHKQQLLDHPNIKLFLGRLMDEVSLRKAIRGCDQIYHLAAFADVWSKNPYKFFEINALGTEKILDIAKECGVQKSVITSTAGVIGPSDHGPVNETTIRLVDYFNEYESSKAYSESLIKDRVRSGEHIVVVSPTRVFGPGIRSKSNSVTKMIEGYTRGKWRVIPGKGDKVGNYVYVDDVIEGHIRAMDKGISGERYLLAGDNVTFDEFFQRVRQISNKNYRLFHFPIPLMMAFTRIAYVVSRSLGKAPPITTKWVRKFLHDWDTDNTKAVQELGMQFTSLNEGIEKILQWLKEE